MPILKSTLIEATKAGAAEILRFFNGDFKISNKEGVNNLVTEADHASEKAIFEVIKRNFPGHFILSEETGEIIQLRLPMAVSDGDGLTFTLSRSATASWVLRYRYGGRSKELTIGTDPLSADTDNDRAVFYKSALIF